MNSDFDEYGRVTEGKDLGHDNPKLFSSTYLLLMEILGYDATTPRHCTSIDLAVTQDEVGLFSRHTEKFRIKHGLHLNTISHDERNGIAIISFFGERYFLVNMINYIKEYKCYADTHVKVKPKINLQTIKFFIDLIKNPKHQDEVDAKYPPEISVIRYWVRPRDMYFYQLAARQKGSILGFIDFHLAWIFSLFFSYKEGQRNSGTLMNAFKMIFLSHYLGIKFPLKVFNYVMRKRLGDKWLYEMCKVFFFNPYHPTLEHTITKLAKEYK